MLCRQRKGDGKPGTSVIAACGACVRSTPAGCEAAAWRSTACCPQCCWHLQHAGAAAALKYFREGSCL